MAYTNIDDPSAYFQTALYTGNAGNQTITNDGNSDLQPDFVWLKSRTFTSVHLAQDSTRGATGGVYRYLQPDNTAAEAVQTDGDGITSLNSDGFSLGFNNSNSWNQSGNTYVAWQWKANGGTTSSNTDGGITTTVQANQDAGFSIVTYTGTGSSNTIGHGLGVAPNMMIVKNRSGAYNWAVYHKDSNSSPEDYYAQLNTENTFSLATDIFGTSPATSSVIGVKNFNETNASGSNYVAYCFASKQGYSKFGSYKGNTNANGAFVYTGFKPAFVLIKKANVSNDSWVILDTARNPYNGMNARLFPDLTNSESTSQVLIDSLSNGFKMRTADTAYNGSGVTYVYMAFAENPFVTSTGIPTTAR